MIYIGSFFLSALFIKIGSKRIDQNKKISAYLCFAVGLLVTAILAGLRDYSIGTDVMGYGNAWFRNAVSSTNIYDYVNWGTSSQIGVLYTALNYVVSIFTNNAHWFYFVLALLINCLIFVGAYSCKDEIDISLAMLAFDFLFYNSTLNLLRQSLAIAIIISGFGFVRKKQFIRYLICVILAFLAHSTAFVGIAVYFLYHSYKMKYSKLIRLGIGAGLLGAALFYQSILDIIIRMGFLGNRYSSYLSDYESGGRLIRIFLFCLPWIIYFFALYKKTYRNDGYAQFWILILTCSSMMTLIMFSNSAALRIAYFFDYFFIIMIPWIAEKHKVKEKQHKNINLTAILIIIYLLIYWGIVYVYQNQGETVPFLIFKN